MDALSTQDMPISDRLDALAAHAPSETVSLEWIMAHLHERAFGLFLLILALPCCIPLLWGIPQIVALPLMFVSAQICIGRRKPWLPERLATRQISRDGLTALAERARPWLRWIEALSKPRLTHLTRAPADRVLGVALVVFSASILVPLPLTNTVPGIAIVIAAMGLLQRDGILIILGMLAGTVWIATLLFAGVTVVSLLRSWVGL